VDFPLQIPTILWTGAACFGICWGAITPTAPRASKGTPIAAWAFLAALALIGLQAAKLDTIAHDNVRLLADGRPSVQKIEAQLLRERAGARKGLGRLALLRARLLRAQRGAGLLAAEEAANAAQRRIADQPLDTNAHLAEAGAWALACGILESGVNSPRLVPEEAMLKAEVALGRAARLEPTNPLVVLQIAGIQNQLSGCSPFRRGHQRRSALALSRAVELDPWVSARAFRMTSELPEEDFSLIQTTSAQSHYEKGLEWRKRGRLGQAKAQLEQALARHPDFAPSSYALGDLLRSQGEVGFEGHFQRYLQLEKVPTGMGAWSALWLGDAQGATDRFEALLLHEPNRIWLRNGLNAAQKQAGAKP
jgi:tetratricopeptide (TPR) repeat protein